MGSFDSKEMMTQYILHMCFNRPRTHTHARNNFLWKMDLYRLNSLNMHPLVVHDAYTYCKLHNYWMKDCPVIWCNNYYSAWALSSPPSFVARVQPAVNVLLIHLLIFDQKRQFPGFPYFKVYHSTLLPGIRADEETTPWVGGQLIIGIIYRPRTTTNNKCLLSTVPKPQLTDCHFFFPAPISIESCTTRNSCVHNRLRLLAKGHYIYV